MDRDETDGYTVQREFSGSQSAEEMLIHIIRAHIEEPDQEKQREGMEN